MTLCHVTVIKGIIVISMVSICFRIWTQRMSINFPFPWLVGFTNAVDIVWLLDGHVSLWSTIMEIVMQNVWLSNIYQIMWQHWYVLKSVIFESRKFLSASLHLVSARRVDNDNGLRKMHRSDWRGGFLLYFFIGGF